MKDFERPSILAVGMPEIFDLVDGQTSDANSIETTESVGGLNPGSRLTSRMLGNDSGLLQWMIYSSGASESAVGNRPSVSQVSLPVRSSFTSSTLGLLSDSGTSAANTSAAASPDDSAYGIEFDGKTDRSDQQNRTGVEAKRPGVDGQFDERPHSDNSDSEVSFIHAGSAKRAIELLRVLRFDLLVTSDQLPDMAMSQFIGRIRAVRPWQKWALVGSTNTTQAEITARSLGAAAVFDAPADLEVISELARAVAAHAPARAAVGAEDCTDSRAASSYGHPAGTASRLRTSVKVSPTAKREKAVRPKSFIKDRT